AAWSGEAEALFAIVSGELRERYPAFCAAVADRGLLQVDSESPQQMRDSALGLSLAVAGIAETGSALMAEPTLADRSVGMLPRSQAIVIPSAALLPSLDEAALILRALAL